MTYSERMSGSPVPTLIVVSGPAGSGKTTLAHEIARAVGCPAICRDEIKEGMAHAAVPGFRPAAGDELTMRTLPVFFGVLEQFLLAGVTSVADAAFQDKLWRPWLTPLLPLARLRIVQCAADPEVAFGRIMRRRARNPVRGAHADPDAADREDYLRRLRAFDRISLDVPQLAVDTTAELSPVPGGDRRVRSGPRLAGPEATPAARRGRRPRVRSRNQRSRTLTRRLLSQAAQPPGMPASHRGRYLIR